MGNYVVNFTDVNTSPITVYEQSVDSTSVDISLFGLIRLNYGEQIQENLLHLLENFSCPEDPLNIGNPNTDVAKNNLLESPIKGQFWFNSTTGVLHFWDETFWNPIRKVDDIAANWGTISTGQQIPRPVSPSTGYMFEYEECIWFVAPAGYDGPFSGMNCLSGTDGTVTMEYKLRDSKTLSFGYANYLIIGIKGNRNLGYSRPKMIINDLTPTPTTTSESTVTPTPTLTPTNTPETTPTITPTVGASPTPAATATPTISLTPTITPTGTAAVTVTPTVTPTLTPTKTLDVTPSITPTIAVTPSVTATVTPTLTLTPTITPTASPLTLGEFTRLYTSPSPGDPGGIGVGGVGEKLANSCGPAVTYSEVEKSHYIYLKDLSGGVPPYVVSFRWITISDLEATKTIINSPTMYSFTDGVSILVSYAGGTAGAGEYERTNLYPGDVPSIKTKLKMNLVTDFNPAWTYLFSYNIYGRIILFDSIGQTRSWWIPSYPTPIGGSNWNDASLTALPLHLQWGHYGKCSHCPDCSNHDDDD